jgi:hypothetical protein
MLHFCAFFTVEIVNIEIQSGVGHLRRSGGLGRLHLEPVQHLVNVSRLTEPDFMLPDPLDIDSKKLPRFSHAFDLIFVVQLRHHLFAYVHALVCHQDVVNIETNQQQRVSNHSKKRQRSPSTACSP